MIGLAFACYAYAIQDLQAAGSGSALMYGAEFLRLRCAMLAGLGSLILAAVA